MTNLDPTLQRLLQAAARAPRPLDAEAPFGFATRVAAQWIAGADRARQQLLWFRRAFLCSVAVAALSVGWYARQEAPQPVGVGEVELAASGDAAGDLP